MPPELSALADALAAADADAARLIDGLTEAQGTWRPEPGAWSVAHCLDHLATANRVYLAAMAEASDRARHRKRRGPALPGLLGGWFVRQMEPPVRRRLRAPGKIVPRSAPPLADAYAAFRAAQERVHAYLRDVADLDLAHIRFRNPFVRGVRFSLATGLHVIAAHDRRHLEQAWRVRGEAERRLRLTDLPVIDGPQPIAPLPSRVEIYDESFE